MTTWLAHRAAVEGVRLDEAVERIAVGADVVPARVYAELTRRSVHTSPERSLNDVIAWLMVDVAEGAWPG
jgi:hypothetical protein